MIRVSMDIKEMLENEKLVQREPVSDCIGRLILELRTLRDEKAGVKKEQVIKEIKLTTPVASNELKVEPIK